MSSQVVRIASYTKGSLQNIGNEAERTAGVEHRNSDIDHELTKFNHSFIDSGGGFYNRFNQIIKEMNCTFKGSKNQTAFEGMIITADSAFFEGFGYVRGKPPPPAVESFFEKSLQWVVEQIGYKGTTQNILSAVVHYDEKTPHMHICYIPIVDKWKEKVYQKDENGKIMRNEHGSPIQAKDERGKSLYSIVEHPEAPKVSRGDFWSERGGKTSYTKLQDSFFENVGLAYGLGRGEIGSNKQHETKYQWKKKQLEKELETVKDEIKSAEKAQEQLHSDVIENDIKNKKLIEENKTLESRQAALIEDIAEKEAEKLKLEKAITMNRLQLLKEQRPPRPAKPEEPEDVRKDADRPTSKKEYREYKSMIRKYKSERKKYYDQTIPKWEKECAEWDKTYMTAANLEATAEMLDETARAQAEEAARLEQERDKLENDRFAFAEKARSERAEIEQLKKDAERSAAQAHIKAAGYADVLHKMTDHDVIKAAATSGFMERMKDFCTPQELDKMNEHAEELKKLTKKKAKTYSYYEMER